MQNLKKKYTFQGTNSMDNCFQKPIDGIRNSDNLQVSLIKILNIKDTYHLKILEQFLNYSHDNLVNVLDIYYENQFTLIVVEKCTNNLLHYFQTNNYKFTTEKIFSFIKQITKGYQQLIEKVVLHRNLEPEKIFYIKRNQDIIFKIAGYENAKLLDDRDQPIDENTKIYDMNYYQAPEASTANYSFNADIFSFGLIILQMATNQKLQNIKELKSKSLENLCKLDMLDDKLKQLLCKMIVYDPQKRLTWSDLIKQLFYRTECKNKQSELVTCLENGQPCYVKIVQKQMIDYQYSVENAKAELDNNRLLKGRDHQNIVKIYEILHEPENKCIYIIMEKCNGSLSDLIQNKTFSFEEILDFIIQINTGYQYLEKQNLIHRDMKPDNILYKLIDNKIQYKIADFGISRQTDSASSKCGTFLYSAPEIDGSHVYTNQCDIYSFGMILYHILTKNYPFDQKDNQSKNKFQQLLKEKQSIEQIYPKNHVSILDERIKIIINKMIVYDPKKRICWGQQIAELVKQIQSTGSRQQYKQAQLPVQIQQAQLPVQIQQAQLPVQIQQAQLPVQIQQAQLTPQIYQFTQPQQIQQFQQPQQIQQFQQPYQIQQFQQSFSQQCQIPLQNQQNHQVQLIQKHFNYPPNNQKQQELDSQQQQKKTSTIPIPSTQNQESWTYQIGLNQNNNLFQQCNYNTFDFQKNKVQPKFMTPFQNIQIQQGNQQQPIQNNTQQREQYLKQIN